MRYRPISFSIAPMMDWTGAIDIAIKFIARSACVAWAKENRPKAVAVIRACLGDTLNIQQPSLRR